jgi:hypothetical protein
MNVLIAATFVPFELGGLGEFAASLRGELDARGFPTEAVLLPFDPAGPHAAEQTLALRLFDLAKIGNDGADLLITLGAPAHALRHPNKVSWLLPDESTDRTAAAPADTDLCRTGEGVYLRECRRVYAATLAGAERVVRDHGLAVAGVLPVPPMEGASRVDWDYVVESLIV